MNIEQAKDIRLTDYLQSIGHSPVSVKNDSAWYHSPLRQEHTPSFKVNLEINMWYDFGLSEGGNIIKLVQLMHNTSSVSEVLRIIAGRSVAAMPMTQYKAMPERSAKFRVKELSHPALLQFITNERKISESVAKRYCKAIHYTHNNRNYFAIAFLNDSGGYVTRNKHSKRCISPNSITSVHSDKDGCYLFEGFMDFLSFKSTNAEDIDFVVLNSVTNLCSGVVEMLSKYSKIHCYLDNDKIGRNATSELIAKLGSKVIDHSKEYAEFKDLNEALCSRGLDAIIQPAPQREITKPKRGIRM